MEKKSFDIISIGDSAIDHFIFFHDAEINCKVNLDICQMCINYGDKLPVDKYLTLTAGNANNNAIGSSLLGLKTAYYAVLGEDEGGLRIKNNLIKHDVYPDYIDIRKGEQTNNSFVLSFKAERTILVYHVPREYKLPNLAETQWIYLTSVAHGYEKLFSEVLALVNKRGIKLCFNPGTFQLRGDRGILLNVIKNSEITFVNVEEAKKILQSEITDVKILLDGMCKLGTSISVITDGSKGAYCSDGKSFFHIGLFNTHRVESTGAGDAFATAFIASIHYGNDLKEALRWGSINGNSVAQKIGPQEGLLKLTELKQLLDANPQFQAEEI